MRIQLSIFLYIYLAFLVLWLSFSVTALYHIFKFGFKNFISYISVFIYIVISVMILVASSFYILQTDWKTDLINVNNSTSAISDWE